MNVDDHTVAHQGVHLVVLHHGLWGNVGHVRYIAEQFKQRLGDRILVYRAQANESALTYDGVDICGRRLVQEIHSVVKVIEDGGNIEEMKGQKHKKKKRTIATTITTTTSPDTSNSDRNLSENLEAPMRNGSKKKVTQFSYLGYSLGGLIGRFAMGQLDLEKFFDPVEDGGRGIEPMYFVTMATPHLGIRLPPLSRWSRIFNYLSARMLSRTGEQLQLIDDYIGGKPLLLIMTERSSIFMHALARFKRRAIYSNIRNDRSVPFWTASFSDADPFRDLDSMEIQYHSVYSSLVESFGQQDLEAIAQRKQERKEALKNASFIKRALHRLKAIPWKKYALFVLLGPILLPLWIVFACSTISIQGLNSRRRTKHMVQSDQDLHRMRDESLITRISTQTGGDDEEFGTALVDQEQQRQEEEEDGQEEQYSQPSYETVVHVQPIPQNTNADSLLTLNTPSNESSSKKKSMKPSTSATTLMSETLAGDSEAQTSLSYPHLKKIKPLALLPVQVEMSKNLNRLKWRKNIIHIETFNAHASIVVREKRFSNDGGVAAVHHAVDMFQDDGEDE
ncbi:putative serine esterase-domain-containing protein [Gamsiella multidivaricata]|uniref:putative serine esterase-domain-containing protein n=1 Tax=Gamsiella multidivaricata TaxID=101098 RepID=UPI00222097B1|nr:putative serine esterase-domain-containing protein [Gamsiella multidivaricata]KAI7826088.1 putative serine esterase-domain-containing protein [Gamsiella multidivaricata]